MLTYCRAVVASVVADALQKAQAQAQQEQAARDAAKAEYEEELARVCVDDLVHTCMLASHRWCTQRLGTR